MRLISLRLLPLFALGLASVHAQNPAASGDQVTTTFSWSADKELTQAGTAVGDLGVSAASLTWRGSRPLSPVTRLNYGLGWAHFDFSRPAASAVPDTLQEVAVILGASHRLNDRWLLTGTVRPGLYGDFEGDNSDAFNAPVLLLATWLRSPTLAWSFGLRADGFSDRSVLPLVGVNWKFSPGWEFSVGLPRTGLSYTAGAALKWNLGVSLQGGNFHIARDPRPATLSAAPRLDDTTLDYHEIRVGLSADWRLSEVFSLTAEAGVITDQKFDYFDRDYVLDGGGTGFFTVELTGRF